MTFGIFPEVAGPCRPVAEVHHQAHTDVPPGNKVAKYDSLECGAMPNRSSLNIASVPIYRTIVR